MMRYSIKELADIAGISKRTLRHYDQIGLLIPNRNDENGYRVYDETAVLRLQQILFFRELDFGLADIQAILDDPTFDQLQALQTHKQALQNRAKRLNNLIQTIDKTISNLQGEHKMSDVDLFEGFSEEQEKEYAQQAREQYDPKLVEASYRRWQNYGKDKQDAIKEEGKQMYRQLLALIDTDPTSPPVQALIKEWHKQIRYFYDPTKEIMQGLAHSYVNDPAFASTYEKMHPNMPTFLRDAILHYTETPNNE